MGAAEKAVVEAVECSLAFFLILNFLFFYFVFLEFLFEKILYNSELGWVC